MHFPVEKGKRMEDWSARQYLRFEDERTRPSWDLLAQVPLEKARTVVDLGCGPGNSTAILVDRFPGAQIIGLDSSPDMLRQARERLPDCSFIEADLVQWTPTQGTDLLFANAVFQWVPDHAAVLHRLALALPAGGVLAVQMPDNTSEPALVLMQETADQGPWAGNPTLATAGRTDLPRPEHYYDLLKPLCARVEIWHTIYNHVMPDHAGVVEWFKGSALRPYLSALDGRMRDDFLAAYTARIARHYPPCFDGKVLLRFPRLFIVATR
jgi:trans-aconitate 2-methyltransferase